MDMQEEIAILCKKSSREQYMDMQEEMIEFILQCILIIKNNIQQYGTI